MPNLSFTIPGQSPLPYSIPLDTEALVIGRSAECNIVLDHPSVSSQHCELSRVPGGFVLRDLNSTNGIHLGEKQMEAIDLLGGTVAQVGDIVVTNEVSEEEEVVFSEEKFKSQQKKKKIAKPKATPKAKPTPAVRPGYPGTSTFQPKPDTSGRDFAIFLACAAAAVFAFYIGLNTAYRATIPKEDRLGKSVWNDKIMGKSAEEESTEES